MKKSSIIVIIIVLAAALAGIFYLNKSTGKEKTTASDPDKTQNAQQADQTESKPGDITFYENTYKISDDEIIKAKCIKSGQDSSIYAIYPVSDKNKYDISSSGYMALYLSKDGSIWLLYSDGAQKKITPDKYGSIDKNDIQKKDANYIWADKPQFTSNGSVRFISDLPDAGDPLRKSIWEINIENGAMKEVYTPTSDNYTPLGDREDGKYLVLDGSNISVIDTANSTSETINADGKYIISLSPDGTKIVYASKAADGKADYKKFMVMDSYGNNSQEITVPEGYTATDAGSWYSDSSRYAFIVKSADGSGDKIAVANFDEDSIDVSLYSPQDKTVFPVNSKLGWIQDNTISVDTGDNIIEVDLMQ